MTQRKDGDASKFSGLSISRILTDFLFVAAGIFFWFPMYLVSTFLLGFAFLFAAPRYATYLVLLICFVALCVAAVKMIRSNGGSRRYHFFLVGWMGISLAVAVTTYYEIFR